MTSSAGLRLSGVWHSFGELVAARDVDLAVEPGEVHCLLGPSGSGKSTVLRLVAGLETLQRGRVWIAGTEVAGPGVHVPPEKRSIGFVFQDYALFPHLSVRRNVLFGMPSGSAAQRDRAVGDLLERVAMADYADAMPHTLSGGQQQRVALARALAREPVVMLLDEPFSGLDAQLRQEIRRTTLDVLREAGVATLMVTHDPQESLIAADVVSVMRAGRIAQTGAPDEVYSRSVSREVAEVFGPVNCLVGQVEEGHVATVCGVVPAPGFEEGTEVRVLVRPESIELRHQAHADTTMGTVTDLEPGGDTVRIQVSLQEGPELEARDLGRRGWRVGDLVYVTLATDSAMVHEIEA